MIDKLMKYSKSWGEFVKYVTEHTTYYWDNFFGNFSDTGGTINGYELEAYLIEWLDSKGIYIITIVSPDEEDSEIIKFSWILPLAHDIYSTPIFTDNEYETRTEATEAGIIKAMELLEVK